MRTDGLRFDCLAALFKFLSIDFAPRKTLVEDLARRPSRIRCPSRTATSSAPDDEEQRHRKEEHSSDEQRTEPHAAPATFAPIHPAIVHHVILHLGHDHKPDRQLRRQRGFRSLGIYPFAPSSDAEAVAAGRPVSK